MILVVAVDVDAQPNFRWDSCLLFPEPIGMTSVAKFVVAATSPRFKRRGLALPIFHFSM